MINLTIEQASRDEIADLFEQCYGLDRFGSETPWRPALRRIPRGWRHRNMLTNSRLFQECILPGVDPQRQVIDPGFQKQSEQRYVNDLWKSKSPYVVLAKDLFTAESHSMLKFALAQSTINEAQIACALERYRLVHGRLPDRLDELAPGFIERLPHDVINGKPLKYRLTGDGQFVLYSVGWNGVDDGGVVVREKLGGPRLKNDEGDWVWRYP